MPYEEHVDNVVHVVDNTDEFDEGIQKLKKVGGSYMKTMSREVPTSWVDFQAKIQEGAKTNLSMSKDEITKIAADCGILRIETALVYLNDVGIILYSKINEKLKNTVITNLPMMIEMLTKIITSVNPNLQDPLLKKSWNMLDRNGILDKSLLRHLWKDEMEQNSDIFEVFVEVMKMFSLVFEMQNKQGKQVLLVPCQMKITTDSLEVKKDEKQTASVYVTPTDFLPDSVYSVLVVGMLNFMEKKGRSIQSKHVKLFQNRSDFDLYDDHRISLGAVKIERRHALMLEISSLPAFDEDGTKVTNTPRPSICLEVLNYLKEQLEIVYGTTKGIGYNLHVCCYMCPNKPMTLNDFHNLDECLSKDIIRCGDKVVTTAHFKCLFAGGSGELSQNPIQRLPEKETATKRTKPEEQRFRSLLNELSSHYPGSNFRWLRFLLFDLLPIEDLSNAGDRAMALFNKLEAEGHISCSNVIVLSEVAQLTKIKSAISCITKYNRANHCDEEGTVLTKHRKTLFSALREVAHNELPDLINYYNLSPYQETFRDVWDLVYHLEKEKLLDETPDKVKRFAGLLSGKAKDVMLDALISSTTKKATEFTVTMNELGDIDVTEGLTTNELEDIDVTEGLTTNEVGDIDVTEGLTTNEVGNIDVTEGLTTNEVIGSSTCVTGGVESKDVTAETKVTCKVTPGKQIGTKRRKLNKNKNRNGQTEKTLKEEITTTVGPNKNFLILVALMLLVIIVLLVIVGLLIVRSGGGTSAD